MRKKYIFAGVIFLVILFTGLMVVALSLPNVAVLNPKGIIAASQRELMIIATILMLIVVVPVFVMTFWFAWRYRESNPKARYTPNWDHNRKLEFIWWAVPCMIIILLAIITWQSSHMLDPYRPLRSEAKPVKIQVVALQWKWLFIYPEQRIATVNYVQFPEDRPVNFEITADAPMNSFWIPRLGGQVYAMTGMTTKLHLMAGETGSYDGSSANLSGEGFAGMKFLAEATTEAGFDNWVAKTQKTGASLTYAEYEKLAKPSKDHPAVTYTRPDEALYDKVIKKYMSHH